MKILIVDDELVSREKLRKIMDSFGQCIVVENGADALRAATSQNPPDLILLDIIMPGMDGYEVCKRLKANRRTSNIPVIFISVRSEEDDETKGLGLGAVDYITKPFSPSIVKARVRTHLELKKHRNRLEEMVNERTVELKKATKEMQVEIAERKQAEEALRKSEEKYRNVVENGNEGILVAQDGKLVFVNKAICEYLDYTKEELISLPDPFTFIYPADREMVFERHMKRLKGEEIPDIYDYRVITKDGEVMWVRVTGVRIDWEGRPATLNFFSDIHDRKQAEEALVFERAQLLSIFDSIDEIVYVTDPDTYEILYVNQSLKDAFQKELIGGVCYSEFQGLDSPCEFCTNEIILKQKPALHRWEHHNPTLDKDFAIVDRIIKWPDGRDVRFELAIDVTDRKRAEEALRESEEKYRTILESIEDGYFEVDIAGNFTFFNNSLCEILGYSKDELMGMNNRQYTDEEDAKELYQTFNTVYATGKPDKGFDWKIIRKDGTRRSVEASVSLRRDAEGEPIGFRGIVRDISEKQRLEAQLQHAQRMESLGTLAGGIAHNFNNLLMGIMAYASLMLLETDPDHPNHKRLKKIEKQVESGSKLTSQLLGYAREGSYEVRRISLNQLVKETSDTFGMTKKEITVYQELSEKLYGIKADQGQIEQVLLNLYVNAADAMPGGGDLFLKTINVADKDMTNKPYKVKPGNYVLLTVKDTGVGIGEETKKRVFEPFFTTKGLGSGTGLGMASAYGTIKGHGGYIDVDSKKGEGTTFSIYLPATEKDVEEEKVSSDELVKGKGTVLLVDDEKMVLDADGEMLEHLGYEVLLAEDGQEALELYKKNQDKIDMVLLDMVMPVMGGGETFDRMKEINTNVKVLLSSGYSIEGEAKEILKRGCDAFIQKPFKLEQLSQKIREILDRK